MRKRTALVLIVLAFFSSLVAGLHTEVTANWAIAPDYCVITIESPQNETYNLNEIALNFTVERNYRYGFSYVLDDQESVDLDPATVSSRPVNEVGGLNYTIYTEKGSAVLANLTDGMHNLTVRGYVVYDWNPLKVVNSSAVVFMVNTKLNPTASKSQTSSLPPKPNLSKTPNVSLPNYPTQISTIKPSLTPSATLSIPHKNSANVAVLVGAVSTIVVALGILAYLAKHRG